jgi:uncharacterized protein YggE
MGSLPQNLVIVSGNATVHMTPDLVLFNIGVETEGKEIRAIVDENNAKTEKIVAVLKARGVTSEELRTSDFSLTALRHEGLPGVYRVTSQVRITRRGTKDGGELIAAAIAAGANDVNGPEFSVTNEKVVQDRCIELAFGDARGKAQKLATLSERKLSNVLAVTDGSSSPWEMKYRSPGVEGGVLGGLSLEPGVHSVECGVTVAFRLE